MANKKHKDHRTSFVDADGNRHHFEDNTAAGLAAQVAVRQYELAHPVKKITRNTTVEIWLAEYLETYVEPYVTKKKYGNYKSRAKRIIGKDNEHYIIGHLPLKDVTPRACNTVLMSLEDCSHDYIRKVMSLMRNAFDIAVDEGLMLKNPAPRLKDMRMPINSKPDGERRPAMATEIKQLYDSAKRLGDRYESYIILIHRFGLRPSEAGRVQRCHFNLKSMTLHVIGTKSKNATREVPIPDDLLPWIEKYEDPFALLVTNYYGKPTTDTKRTKMWYALKRDIHINNGGNLYRNEVVPPFVVAEDLELYCLRHNYAGDMIAKGIPIDIVKLLMGHATSKITNRYIDLMPEMIKLALSKINPKNPQPLQKFNDLELKKLEKPPENDDKKEQFQPGEVWEPCGEPAGTPHYSGI